MIASRWLEGRAPARLACVAAVTVLPHLAYAQDAAAPVPPASAATVASPVVPSAPELSLADAVRSAVTRHPLLQQARGNAQAAAARADEALAPLLPQVSGNASYLRATYPQSGVPFANRPGSYGLWNFGITATQLVYDFGATTGNYHAAQENGEVSRFAEDAARLNLVLAVRTAYFQARQQRALMAVAQETLANVERHLEQVRGFLAVGTRSPIDLAQAQADRQSAALALVNAQNGYAIAKAQLVQAMGLETHPDFDVRDESLPAVPGEDDSPRLLYAQALAARPDVRAALGTVRAQQLSESALKGNYGPALGVSTGVDEAGPALDRLRWTFNAQATLSWQIFQGGLTRAQRDEAHAKSDVAKAQADSLRQQVSLAVEQARLGVEGAKQALATATVLVENARERFALADARYTSGAGSSIELGDAQAALSTALQQRVQAEFGLATARASLLNALGAS